MTPQVCAICCAETRNLTQQPLGRGDALVPVCMRCDGEHPRSGRYSFGGGREKQPEHGRQGGLQGTRGTKKSIG